MKANDAITLGKLALKFGRTHRVTYHEDGKTLESDTDHTVMLGLIACHVASEITARNLVVTSPEFRLPSYDVRQVAAYALVHDIVEARCGDTNSFDMTEQARRKKEEREKEAFLDLCEEFGSTSWMMDTLHNYEEQKAPEARLVRFLDKAMPKITHALNGCASIQGMGKTKEDLVRAHRLQFQKLTIQYPEFAGTFVADLLRDLMQLSEEAYRTHWTWDPANPDVIAHRIDGARIEQTGKRREDGKRVDGWVADNGWEHWSEPGEFLDHDDALAAYDQAHPIGGGL
jgi:5'-deoxynucleotidase YfbR-like HD superfamily hydrolase